MRDFFLLAAVLLIHECGHAAASRICGAPVYGVGTRAGGLSLLCRADRLSYADAAFIYVSGAAANFLCAALFFRFRTFAAFSTGAAVFNLLPLPGSDGENFCSAVIACATDDPIRASLIVGRISDACVFLFWAAAVYLSLTGRCGMTVLFFAVMLVVYRLGTKNGRLS